MHNFAVFIGRFQPFHFGHKVVVDEALNKAEKVIVCVGSSGGPRSYRNPFTFKERQEMILSCYNEEQRKRIYVTPINDHPYNEDAWIEEVQRTVTRLQEAVGGSTADTVLIGHSKDSSSYYLKMFPNWEGIEVPNFKSISSTPLRKTFFSFTNRFDFNDWSKHLSGIMPMNVRQFLSAFFMSAVFDELALEFEFIEKYEKQWGKGPFVTVDACVVQAGHVLMIRRGARPGKGLLALPGGFLNLRETVAEGALRELQEETQIDVPPAVLRGSFVASEVFDSPNRDPRARIITHTHLYSLPKRDSLPSIKAADDAADARWMPLGSLKESECFGDHYHMVQRMRGYLPPNPR
jgi:bifunctional NMN adenylyltransferase/nudix hydrolase